MAITNTTKIEAVNTMLSAVGSSPVSTLTGQQTADAVVAQNILDEVVREVTSQGWAFNYERKVELAPDSDNQIVLGTDVARIDNTPGYNTDYDVVQRGNKLYDRKSHSYTISETLTCDVIYFMEFDDTPEAARRYMMIRAARIFQDRMVGSGNHHTYNMTDEVKALTDLKEHEGDTADHSIFDNYDVYRVIDRPTALRSNTSIETL
tara:strand:+ start:1305 stop:1922 length:618 start_codon:yes stop_codon:yes gene_type:complete